MKRKHIVILIKMLGREEKCGVDELGMGTICDYILI
jgi:hypothetical protein